MSKVPEIPEIIYMPNRKSGTAGFDKWVKDSEMKTAWSTWVYYKNKRTNEKKQFSVTDGKLETFYKIVFYHIAEYFVWRLKKGDGGYFKNFEHELKNIEEKYPEYFI